MFFAKHQRVDITMLRKISESAFSSSNYGLLLTREHLAEVFRPKVRGTETSWTYGIWDDPGLDS